MSQIGNAQLKDAISSTSSCGAMPPDRLHVAGSVHQVNTQLIEILCVLSRARAAPFPLSDPIRERFTTLTDADRSRLSCCGTLLIDLGLTDSHRWSSASLAIENANWAVARSNHWLPAHEGAIVAHSSMMVVWSILHTCRHLAKILLGISRATADVVVSMGLNELSHVAYRHPEWVGVRWAHVPGVWSGLLDAATDLDKGRGKFVALRGLQMSLLPERKVITCQSAGMR